ncbi:MAG TPA: radical SAM protein [Solirubrobacteraceae bacterium]|nr:radical SAM protein [Solirubrobacteraceae bacterium]
MVRRFDAPEALESTFYEVRAKSALNRVPAQSRMPFRWTINPYRGCLHACRFCLSGETPILMADGRHRPLSEVEVGDTIYGTRRAGDRRRYALGSVLARWSVVKSAYRIHLEDGTELVAGGEHRFLTASGWQHVVGAAPGEPERPHLSVGTALMGTGRFAAQPERSEDYRRGYVCGLVRSGGPAAEDGGRHDEALRFCLALTDVQGLARARAYLDSLPVDARERVLVPAGGGNRRADAAVEDPAPLERVRALIRWPSWPSLHWCRGFLAGVFDGAGQHSELALRILAPDPQVLRHAAQCLERLAFDTSCDRRNDGLACLRVRGGLPAHLRFFFLTDPAITRKRSIEGQPVSGSPGLRVAAIDPLGELELHDITTSTRDFIADGVVSHNCFARPTHTYLGFNAAEDFDHQIVVKVNAPEVLRVELARPSWKGEHVALGTNTDPYQWVEGRYKLMRGIWEALRDHANPCSVLTKSPLLLRDLDLMRELNERTSFSANLSIPTIDERAWRATEPRTPHPRARLEAVAALHEAGITVGVLIAPLMPGINDDPRQVEEIVELAKAAGASSIGGIALHLRGEVRQVFMGWLRGARPDLVERYEELYRRGAYAPVEERRRLAEMVRRGPFLPGSGFEDPSTRLNLRGDLAKRSPAPARAPPAAQDSLF